MIRLRGFVAIGPPTHAGVFCIFEGPQIVRMHDVRATIDAVRITESPFSCHQLSPTGRHQRLREYE